MSFLINPYVLTPPPAAATREYRALTYGGSTAASVTVPSCDIGSPETGRYVFAALLMAYPSSSGSRTLTAVTIGGVAARVNAQIAHAYQLNSWRHVALASAQLDSGSAVDIVATLNSTPASFTCLAASYKVVGLQSNVETDTAGNNSDSYSSSKSLSVDVEEDGLLFDAIYAQVASGTPTYSYSGVGKDVQSAASSTAHVVTGSLEVSADEASRAIQLSSTVNYRGPRVAAAFR